MSRNYKEDQFNELEALDSIYCGEMEILETEPFAKFKIPIATEEYAEDDNGIACQLLFTMTPTYPDAAPNVEVEDEVNFEDGQKRGLLTHMQQTIEENLGMEMIFSLVSSAQEWLNERWDEHKNAKDEETARKLLEVEEAERKRFEGTRVSVETFMKWKQEFEESTGIAAKREKLNDCKKITGKELFMRDTTLNDSDIKYLLEAGDSIENVKIDESLFQDIGDIELDEDDEDDADWVPGAESD